jgi:hypothetical protein
MKAILIITAMFIATAAFAYGWGDYTTRNDVSGTYDSGWLTWNGSQWLLPSGAPQVNEDITAELWIQEISQYTLQNVDYRGNRGGDLSDVNWEIPGQMYFGSNAGAWRWVICGNVGCDLTKLTFHDAAPNAGNGVDIPVSWQFRAVDATWHDMNVENPQTITYPLPIGVQNYSFGMKMHASLTGALPGHYVLDPTVELRPVI